MTMSSANYQYVASIPSCKYLHILTTTTLFFLKKERIAEV